MVLPVLAASFVLICIRMAKGPTLLDRVVALDLLSTTGIAIILAFAVLYEEDVFIDATVVLAVIMFLSTVAFSYFYQRKGE